MLKLRCLTLGTAMAVLAATLPAQERELPSGLFRASQVIGMDVRNGADQNMGDIEEIVLDRESGSIAYAVVSFGGFLGVGDKMFAVPWTSLKTSADRKFFVLDLLKARLEKAPGFDKNNWPNMSDPQWRTEIRTFYGAPANEAANAKRRDQMRDDEATIGLREDRLAKLFRDDGNRQFVVHTGKVKTFQRTDPAQLFITSNRGGEIQAELAPTSFLDQHRLAFDTNADVTLTGYEIFRNGRTTFVATEVKLPDGRVVQLRRAEFTPLWTDHGRGAVAAGTPLPAGMTSALYDLSGTVVNIESGACESAYGRLATIRTDAGERFVALGPGSNLDRQNWVLHPTDAFVFRGYDYRAADRTYFIATEVRRGNATWRIRSEDGTPLWTN